MPFKLQEGEVRIISLEQCQSYFDVKTITARMICAGYESGTVDSCMVSGFLVTEVIQFSKTSVGPYKLIFIHVWPFGNIFFENHLFQMYIHSVVFFTQSLSDPSYCSTCFTQVSFAFSSTALHEEQHPGRPQEEKQLFISLDHVSR